MAQNQEAANAAPVDEFATSMEQSIDGPAPGVHEAFYEDPTFWVLISFTFFIATLVFLKLPAMVGRMLDERSEGIANQVAEARKLREEAQTLLASYERQQHDAVGEAQEILDHAKVEAERAAADAKIAMEETIARREALAQDKITQAEATAVKEVRDVAVEVAVATARILVAENLQADQADALVDKSIDELGQHLS
jgi:F-type H+-transporting ATPase subunit b